MALLGRTSILRNVGDVPTRTHLKSLLSSQVSLHFLQIILSQNVYSILSDTQNLVRTAVDVARTARSHAMEARLSKQPASQNLHTTAGLTAAKNTIADNTVFISAQCRIKTLAPKDQKNTDPAYGQWGKPWPKDTYMSGKSFPFLSIHPRLIFSESGRGS